MTDPTLSWQPGEIIAEKYVLLKPIAKGGMGSVWVAQNQLTERRVAIKFMLPELSSSPDTIQRFFREAKASARIDHPSIVDVLDLGTLPDGAPFLVMEYLEGRSLERIIDTEPLSPLQAAAIMLDVVRALQAAHVAGIVHRDLKPANIFIAKRGDALVPKILDFGISKITSTMGDIRMTRTGAVLGSPAYMSPEQARGRSDIDGRADIWAVGVILYEAVSGKLPFEGENYNQVMMSITLDPPAPLASVAKHVDADFIAIADACLEKERDQRPPSMEALATLLEIYVAARAKDGIPPIDIGEGVPSQKAGAPRFGAPTYRLASYAAPRSRPPPSIDVDTTQRSSPVQMTVGAVTILDVPKNRSRGAVMAMLALVLVGGAAFGGWWFVGRGGSGDRAGTATTTPSVKATTEPAAVATTADTAGSASETAAAIDSESGPIASASAPASTSDPASASAIASASASSASTTKPPAKPPATGKPWVPPPRPKGSASTKPTADEGPASVGSGPGF